MEYKGTKCDKCGYDTGKAKKLRKMRKYRLYADKTLVSAIDLCSNCCTQFEDRGNDLYFLFFGEVKKDISEIAAERAGVDLDMVRENN